MHKARVSESEKNASQHQMITSVFFSRLSIPLWKPTMVDFSECKWKVADLIEHAFTSFAARSEKSVQTKLQPLCMKISQWNDFHSIYSVNLLFQWKKEKTEVEKSDARLKGVPMTYFAYFKLAFVYFFFLCSHSSSPSSFFPPRSDSAGRCYADADSRFIMYCALRSKICVSACTVVYGYLNEHWHFFVACKSCGKQIRWEGIYKFDERHLSIFFLCMRLLAGFFAIYKSETCTQCERWQKIHGNRKRLIVCTI